MSDIKYLHGFSSEEQDRLIDQAESLASELYQYVNWPPQSHILEVACGVGAQSKLLLDKFKDIKITGIDVSDDQLRVAEKRLHSEIAQSRFFLKKDDAMNMSFKSESFDGAYLCWVLEHLPNPQLALNEVYRVLKGGAKVFINEVQNHTFFLHPYSPATLKYWYEFNDHQWNIGGDPFVGSKMGNYLKAAGFSNIEVKTRSLHYDNREPQKREERITYWTRLLLSGAPALLDIGKIDKATVEEMKLELEALKKDPNSVFYYSFMFAEATK
ncbi:MAG: class I SAM-dependent methyltransferase [Bdellovibrionales bacterium]|nr:class I SAM-dependent methyltransferase [Bdellovibrionales bacterium]